MADCQVCKRRPATQMVILFGPERELRFEVCDACGNTDLQPIDNDGEA